MSENIVTPHFLTNNTAEGVIDYIENIIKDFHGRGWIKRQMCHIVILVPSMENDWPADSEGKPNYNSIEPHLLYEYSLGEKKEWPHEFDKIARSKALQLWHGRNDGRTDCMPHLLFPGDTPWWGGVKRDGIVVACSGFQSHFDRMFAGMIADMCIGMAYDDWAEARPELQGDFLK